MSSETLTGREEQLKVQVVAGRQLAAKNAKNGFSDAYVKLKLNNEKTKYKTKPVKKNLNPEWRELYTFSHVNKSSDKLNIEVWDSSVFSNNFMGQIEIKLSSIEASNDGYKWYTLEGRGKDEEVSGEICLKIYFERYSDLIRRYSIEKRL